MATAGAGAGKQGEKAGKSFGSKAAGGLKSFSGLISKAGVLGFGAAAFEILKQGSKLEDSQVRLNAAIRSTGGSAKAAAPQLDAVRQKMEKWGFTNADVNTSLGTLTTATGSVRAAMKAEGTAADLARFKHISLGAASDILAKSFAGNARALKGLNLTVATGTTYAKALDKGQKDLGDQIDKAGGIAKFAAEKHLSLATAQKLVHQASGAATAGELKLAGSGLSLATATSLVAQAQAGSVKATKTLAAHHLTLSSAIKAVKDSTTGSIPALNKLGVVVLPASATAAQRFGEITQALNHRIGGQAAAAAKTAAGQFGILKAQFTDIAAKVGAKVLPVLAHVLAWLQKSHVLIPLVTAVFVGLAAIMAANAIAALSLQAALTGGISIAVIALTTLIIAMITHWHRTLTIFNEVWKWIRSHQIFALLLGPIGLVIIALIQLGEHWKGLVTVIKAAVKGTSAAVGALAHNVATWFGRIKHDITSVWDATWKWVGSRPRAATQFIDGLLGKLRHNIAAWFDHIRHDVTGIWDGLWHWAGSRLIFAIGVYGNLLSKLRHNTAAWFDHIKADVTGIWDKLWRWVGSRLSDASSFVTGKIDTLAVHIRNGFNRIKGWVTGTWDSMWRWLHDRTSGAITSLGGVLHRLEGIFSSPVKWVADHVFRPLAKVWNLVGHVFHAGLGILPTSFGFARGGAASSARGSHQGHVRGPGGTKGDKIPALLSDREYVQPADAVEYYGLPFMEAIRARKFASGGSPRKKPVPGLPANTQGASGGFPNPVGFIKGLWSSLWSTFSGLTKNVVSRLAGLIPGGEKVLEWIAKNTAGRAAWAMKAIVNAFLPATGAGGLIRAGADSWITAAADALANLFASNRSQGGTGAMRNPLRAVKGLVGERIDQGVDYAGNGNIYAITSGIIKAIRSGGWPGGAFIDELLTASPYAGKRVYFAENITPRVRIGQRVNTSTVIGNMHGGIEAGWASQGGGDVSAAGTGQGQAASTRYGVNFNQLMRALGAPSGVVIGRPYGPIGKGYFSKKKGLGGSTAGNPSGSVAGWARGLLRDLGDPASRSNINSLGAWARLEGGNWHNSARFNPLNTTQRAPGSHSINSVGVQSYTSWREGNKAEADTIRNGFYRLIASDLHKGIGLHHSNLAGEFATWGTGAGAWRSMSKGGLLRFASGGVIREPVIGIGLHTGRPHSFAENGPERVQPMHGGLGDDDRLLIAEIRKLQRITSQVGREFADALNGVARRAGR